MNYIEYWIFFSYKLWNKSNHRYCKDLGEIFLLFSLPLFPWIISLTSIYIFWCDITISQYQRVTYQSQITILHTDRLNTVVQSTPTTCHPPPPVSQHLCSPLLQLSATGNMSNSANFIPKKNGKLIQYVGSWSYNE